MLDIEHQKHFLDTDTDTDIQAGEFCISFNNAVFLVSEDHISYLCTQNGKY